MLWSPRWQLRSKGSFWLKDTLLTRWDNRVSKRNRTLFGCNHQSGAIASSYMFLWPDQFGQIYQSPVPDHSYHPKGNRGREKDTIECIRILFFLLFWPYIVAETEPPVTVNRSLLSYRNPQRLLGHNGHHYNKKGQKKQFEEWKIQQESSYRNNWAWRKKIDDRGCCW